LLLSMTGFGEAHRQQDAMAVAVEVRTINSRYFKISLRCGEGYGSLEPKIESLVRQRVRRGTVQVNLRVDRTRSPEDYLIDARVLADYRRQLEAIRLQWQLSQPVPLESLLLLPGVASETTTASVDAAADWPAIRQALEAALESLAQMRAEEGRAMAADLRANCRAIGASLDEIESRAPLVVEGYRSRLAERLRKTLAEFEVTVDPADLVREVSLFAERCDISEEIVRLRSHLEQFDAIMELPESSGRKLDFLTQEMFREANTIGAKANNAEIAGFVIEAKTAIERIREMIQNVE
jgi:uncharacterized protein (TIGR00255 family)